VVETLHFVRNTEDVTYNGVPYTAAPFDIELKAEAASQPQVTLTMRDYSRDIQARMQAYGGGVGFNVTIMIINGGALSAPPEVVEYFQVVGAHAANYVVSFTLGAENALSFTFPRRRQTKDFCQWRYKDPDTCGYTGGLPTCDLSLQGENGCAAHNNSERFGGFPGINSNGVRYG
jgi:phage-related protein